MKYKERKATYPFRGPGIYRHSSYPTAVQQTTVYSDTTIGFLDACDKYDDSYFDKQVLVMVLLEEGSGSIKHKVNGVGTVDSKLIVDIDTIVPEAGTADMAEWHILIEPEAGIEISSVEDVVVFLDGQNATDKKTEVSHSKWNGRISSIP